MGDISDMILEGILCEVCGGFVGGIAPGYPRMCKGCKRDEAKARRNEEAGP